MRNLCVILALALPLPIAACGGDTATPSQAGSWVGDVTTEGKVTTVRNEAGSKWGGPATLVEQASIGVETGPPEYMLGSVRDLWITDEEIYLIDSQAPKVRVYDWNGLHLRDIGQEGQGPGEYERPADVLVGADGRVYVSESGSNPRINVYSSDGESLETWRWGSTATRMTAGSLVMRHDASLWTRAYSYPSGDLRSFDERIIGVQQFGPQGGQGELIEQPDLGVERTELRVDDQMTYGVAYAPSQISVYSPTGAWIVGDNSSYGFEIHYPDGRIVRTQRYWEPVPIEADHVAYMARSTTSSVRRFNEHLATWSWDGAEIPDHKPAYYSFYPTQGNQVLVVREGPSHRVAGCNVTFDLNTGPEDECYPPERTWDMFDLEGNYLGEVIRPEVGRLFTPFWRDDILLLVVEDEMGTPMVKRFRFELPAGDDVR